MKTHKSYSVSVFESKSKTAHVYAHLMAEGKPGEVLVRNGFGKDAYCRFLAKVASAGVAAGMTEDQLFSLFSQLDAGNSSAVRQACEAIMITFDGEKAQNFASLFPAHSGKGGKPDLTLAGLL
jgi:hypothetical protein